ncbi:GTP-binding protein [Candidatus Woesearchaeota archaeon]|jgi:uncharacterized protein|nr:GTP-binding protein [Candidatus Woesearchaeota archaeon]MBT4368402.1 GTP-binding protein [Candidatus Woesearchaeota archaeon]MBT4712891.1 GTP-binding protein [Candidatus Woesearchaeota archaeon]MBT6639803.1 GTP-binding protein [Candidatus Woesearchaeota archaeon]MBT7133975.1 GTP-binding protein [Candidatus Woesearchaeota archaeon]
MALPHIIQKQLIKKRLIGKEGKTKLLEIEKIMEELPGYNTGPYGELKTWLRNQVKKTKTVANVKHQDWLGVKRQGKKQFMLVGSPSVGKSSLLKLLSGLQTKVAAYEFTTLKPLPAIVNINHADFQIVDLPGLVEGAVEDVGSGKRLIGLVKGSDGIILMHDLSKPLSSVETIANELRKANINKPLIVVGNKIDLARANLPKLEQYFPNKVIGISTITGEGITRLKQELWDASNLIRIFPKHEPLPIVLKKNATIKEFVEHVHTSLLDKFRFARVTGRSAKFPNQQVGLKHMLEDNDVVELVVEK